MPQVSFVIDPVSFVRDQRELSGVLPQSLLPRVAQEVVEPQRELSYHITGEQDRDGQLWLTVTLTGVLMIECQRCLKPLEFNLSSDTTFLLVPEGTELSEDDWDDDSFEPLEFNGQLDLEPIFEDEVLLALPISPRHAQCDTPEEAVSQDKDSPFAVLAGLRGKGNTTH